MSIWPGKELSRDPKRRSDAHQYFCHSVVWSVDDTWVFCGSASRQLTLSQLIFSSWLLQSEGNREAVENTVSGELWVLEHFPRLKKETMLVSICNLWMSWKITRVPQKSDVCQSGGNCRSVYLNHEKATSAPHKSVMSELSHLITPCLPPTWPKEWRSREGEKESCRNGHICFPPGPQ